MLRVIFFAIAVLFPLAGQAAEFTIATFNAEFLTRPKVHIKFGLPFDLSVTQRQEWDAPGFRDQKFAEAATAVAEVLAGIDADVLALTEVGNEQDVLELRDAIAAQGVAYDHVAVCSCTDTVTRQHVAVLSRVAFADVVPILPGREHYLTELDDPESEKDTGISKGMRVGFQAEGHDFVLFVVHLASERGGHEQDAQRIAQASIVRRLTVPLLNADTHVIVAGDLNDYRGQPAIRRIRGLDDIWPDLIQTGQAEYFGNDALGTRWTYEFMGERNQIDHILVSDSVKSIAKIKARVLEHGVRLASDHRPFIVTLEMR